jgi:hypothetical protein
MALLPGDAMSKCQIGFWATLLAVVAAMPVSAHERRAAGAVQVVLGWGDEPAFAGSRNSISVSLTDASGPAKDAAVLSVEVAFGGQRLTLPLEPVSGRPGEYRAWLVPTRSGTYTFRITGKIREQVIDITSTCSDKTFHCVEDASAMQFPAKDPSTGQLADRLERALPRADRATSTAERAQLTAMTALALAVIGVIIAVVSMLRKPRTHA